MLCSREYYTFYIVYPDIFQTDINTAQCGDEDKTYKRENPSDAANVQCDLFTKSPSLYRKEMIKINSTEIQNLMCIVKRVKFKNLVGLLNKACAERLKPVVRVGRARKSFER